MREAGDLMNNEELDERDEEFEELDELDELDELGEEPEKTQILIRLVICVSWIVFSIMMLPVVLQLENHYAIVDDMCFGSNTKFEASSLDLSPEIISPRIFVTLVSANSTIHRQESMRGVKTMAVVATLMYPILGIFPVMFMPTISCAGSSGIVLVSVGLGSLLWIMAMSSVIMLKIYAVNV